MRQPRSRSQTLRLRESHFVEDVREVGYSQPVVGHRHLLSCGEVLAGDEHAAVEHAATAVDDEVVRREILGEVSPRYMLDGERLADALAEEAGKLDGANVLALGSVGASLRNKYTASGREPTNGTCPSDKSLKVTTLGAHEDGERGESTTLGDQRLDGGKDLRVGDDELRRGG